MKTLLYSRTITILILFVLLLTACAPANGEGVPERLGRQAFSEKEAPYPNLFLNRAPHIMNTDDARFTVADDLYAKINPAPNERFVFCDLNETHLLYLIENKTENYTELRLLELASSKVVVVDSQDISVNYIYLWGWLHGGEVVYLRDIRDAHLNAIDTSIFITQGNTSRRVYTTNNNPRILSVNHTFQRFSDGSLIFEIQEGEPGQNTDWPEVDSYTYCRLDLEGNFTSLGTYEEECSFNTGGTQHMSLASNGSQHTFRRYENDAHIATISYHADNDSHWLLGYYIDDYYAVVPIKNVDEQAFIDLIAPNDAILRHQATVGLTFDGATANSSTLIVWGINAFCYLNAETGYVPVAIPFCDIFSVAPQEIASVQVRALADGAFLLICTNTNEAVIFRP